MHKKPLKTLSFLSPTSTPSIPVKLIVEDVKVRSGVVIENGASLSSNGVIILPDTLMAISCEPILLNEVSLKVRVFL